MKKIFCLMISLLALAGAGEERLTVKGSWYYSNALSMRSDYLFPKQSQAKMSNYVYGVDGSLGFGAEYVLVTRNSGVISILPKNMDISGGFNYVFPRNIYHASVHSPGNQNLPKEKFNFTPGWLTVQSTSFYLKTRYFLGYNNMRFFNIRAQRFYTSGRISYTMLSLNNSFADITHFRNALGWGLSLGSIVNDDWDIELLYESFSGNLNNSVHDSYTFNNAVFSVGYLLDAAELWSKISPIKYLE